jgi:hypothetical protein
VAKPRKRTGPVTTPAPPRTTTTGKQFDVIVTDLTTWRTRRLVAPWPGFWAGREMATWTWAERSRWAS